MRLTRELVLCALARAGGSIGTTELLASVRELAVDGGWPPEAIARWTAKMLPPMLRKLEREGVVRSDRTGWLLCSPTAELAMIPSPPTTLGEHDLDGMTREQLITVFEVQSDAIAELHTILEGFARASATLFQGFDQIKTRARRRLYSVGLGDRLEGEG